MAKVILFFLAACLHAEVPTTFPLSQETPGLIIRLPPLNPEMLEQLAHMGMQFAFPSSPQPKEQSLPHLEESPLFLTNFHRISQISRKWLEPSLIRPNKQVTIDTQK